MDGSKDIMKLATRAAETSRHCANEDRDPAYSKVDCSVKKYFADDDMSHRPPLPFSLPILAKSCFLDFDFDAYPFDHQSPLPVLI